MSKNIKANSADGVVWPLTALGRCWTLAPGLVPQGKLFKYNSLLKPKNQSWGLNKKVDQRQDAAEANSLFLSATPGTVQHYCTYFLAPRTKLNIVLWRWLLRETCRPSHKSFQRLYKSSGWDQKCRKTEAKIKHLMKWRHM